MLSVRCGVGALQLRTPGPQTLQPRTNYLSRCRTSGRRYRTISDPCKPVRTSRCMSCDCSTRRLLLVNLFSPASGRRENESAQRRYHRTTLCASPGSSEIVGRSCYIGYRPCWFVYWSDAVVGRRASAASELARCMQACTKNKEHKLARCRLKNTPASTSRSTRRSAGPGTGAMQLKQFF